VEHQRRVMFGTSRPAGTICTVSPLARMAACGAGGQAGVVRLYNRQVRGACEDDVAAGGGEGGEGEEVTSAR